ncbi:NMDA receptor-regulated protein 1-domain-containing protein [Clohesyomyces aquaticus]|uniref:DNA-(apurinic or apyrimidinic site) lyase n=1 Tax=Clohesyomyces aquaticus TaxID=1231657 RepID=A0A1Y1ZBX4_9PLEO|nr:NMDA receptor-regulated protein 1-domain-containing protein [Clohesyomyces aquaticus]
MPEIGEVARVVHYLKKHLVGKTIASVIAQEDAIVYGKVGTSASAFQNAMTGKKVVDARQQGKYFWLEMESPPHPLMHLGMSGWIKFSNDDSAYYRPKKGQESEWPPRYCKFVLKVKEDPDCEVAFVDARRLARIRLVDAKGEDMRKTTPLKENGPDPVIDPDVLTVAWLTKKLRSKRVPVKALLLDQANISGIGNWVGDEIMYQARLHPEQYSNTFSDAQVKQLHDAMIYVCKTAVETLADSEKFPEDWLMRHRWDKGKKNGGKLPNGAKITFLKVGGRTSAVVPSVQKKTGAVAGDVEDTNGTEESDEDVKPKKKGTKRTKAAATSEDEEGDVEEEEEKPKKKATKRKKETVKAEDVEEEEEKPKANTGRGRKKAVKDEPAKETEVQEGAVVNGEDSRGRRRSDPGAINSDRRRGARHPRSPLPNHIGPHRPTMQPLQSKEASLFRSVVKFYESKQYKKGLKAAEQILRKVPDHGDTQAMKALILNSTGQTDEAFALAKLALRNDMKSHVCWHVYGLLWRSQKNYEEAIKAYKMALRIESDSQNILRDLALLQIQMRDYQGYIESRSSMLKARAQLRQNWTALAIAHHLAGNYKSAEHVLTTFENTLKNPMPKGDLEHSEAVLYKNTLIAESGETERALEHLQGIMKDNLDRTAVLELQAKYLLELGKTEEAEKAYRALLARNNEYREYYDGLEKALGLDRSDPSSHDTLKAIYDSYAAKNERLDAPRRIPLDFLKGDAFREAADKYLRRMLNKGVPSTFPNIKALYADPEKKAIIEELALGYTSEKSMNGSTSGGANGKVSDRFEQSVLSFLAQHYNFHMSRDLDKAMEYADRLIEMDPKSVDYNQLRARIWKHYGNTQKASEIIEHARALDEKDRYINTKCAKYQLRNNENEAALNTMSKFTRNETVGGPLGDLHDMQCMWFLLEDGDAYLRQRELGLALKRFTAIADIFEIWHDDQFDFHSFSLRKGQIRAYVDMVRWEDHLRDHPFFTRAAISAIKIYLKLADNPGLSGSSPSDKRLEDMDPVERKRAQKKAKKEQLEKEKAEAERKALAAKKAVPTGDGEVKKEDPDPKGITLVQTKEPLEASLKFLKPLLEFSPKNIEAQNLGFEVYSRRGKWLLALRCLHQAQALDAEDPKSHEQFVRLQLFLNDTKDISPKVLEAIKQVVPDKLSPAKLKERNESYGEKHAQSVPHLLSTHAVRLLLDQNVQGQVEADTQKLLDLPSITIEQALKALDYLDLWGSDAKTKEAYRSAASKKWPEATIFL